MTLRLGAIGSIGPTRVEPTEDRPAGPGFAAELERMIAAVDRLQLDADAEAAKVAAGAGNLHEAALALEKADVAMRVAVKVRNRFVEAYQEIMRMNV